MGLRFRKSIKIAPGVKLNLSKKSVGVSAGVKGARVSVNSKGRVTKSVGIPGTGLSYVKTGKLGGSASEPKQDAAFADKIANDSIGDNGPLHSADNGNSAPSKGKGPKGILRWLLYVLIVFVATAINENLCYPGMLLAGMIHMFHVKKTIFDEKKRKMSTIRTCCFLVFSILGCFITIAPSAPDIESISISAVQDTMDINEEQVISLTYKPEDANYSNISVEISNDDLATAALTDDRQIALKAFEKEGEFTLLVKSGSIESNELSFTIVDVKKAEEERIAAEKKAEEERIAAEKKAEAERIAAEQNAAEEKASAASQQAQQSNSRTVYVTPTGKRYHYSSSCGNGTYNASTLDQAIAMGLTPCKKCVK